MSIRENAHLIERKLKTVFNLPDKSRVQKLTGERPAKHCCNSAQVNFLVEAQECNGKCRQTPFRTRRPLPQWQPQVLPQVRSDELEPAQGVLINR
jgi:hypothetical protein